MVVDYLLKIISQINTGMFHFKLFLQKIHADNGAGVHINSLNDTYTNAYFDNVHFIQNSGNRNVGLRIYGNVWPTGIKDVIL